ncbi:hypothetical protein BD311DRAFT_765911 [Dichomitus squalens]|uniref:Uncharacterized protein n=1 Tax=Dichomitus squalens TaxID=114155 RepID=A0A4Q9MDS6_9APHY|nr:hypothetical protein BD311DRAFT_765911 [Dichomitus squalens]
MMRPNAPGATLATFGISVSCSSTRLPGTLSSPYLTYRSSEPVRSTEIWTATVYLDRHANLSLPRLLDGLLRLNVEP